MKHSFHWLSRAAVLVPALALAVLALVPGATKGPAPSWRSDLDAARREAKRTGKDVLVAFTVRGGEGSAPVVDQVVFDDERFLRTASQRFVPVRLTVNTDAASGRGDAGVVALAESLAITRVPALVLMDAAGRPYAAVESDVALVDAQLELLGRAAAARGGRDEAIKEADASTGADRAMHLHRALERVGRFALTGYEATVAEVISLDADNRLGLCEKWAAPLAARRVDRGIQTSVYPLIDRADFAGAIGAIDRLLDAEKPPAAQARLLVGFKAELLLSMGRRDEARRLFEQALAASGDAESTEKIARAMQRLEQ